MDEKLKEEILEAFWISMEQRELIKSDMTKVAHAQINQNILSILKKEELINIANDEIQMTEKGKEKASIIIRRHRLAERLMVDVLNMNINDIEENACEFEHILAPELTESICTLLGHPQICPHGHFIPKGKCCDEARNSVENVLTSLDNAEIGENFKIAYISSIKHPVLHKLISFGLVPGTIIKIHQKSPSFVIQLDNSQLAIEKDVASRIFIWR